MKPLFFKTPAAFRQWLAKNHAKTNELWIGFYKKSSGKPSITYHEALDEALCFGWIDGVRKRLDEESYIQRFTPRRAKSIWSNININRVAELKKSGKMESAGLQAFKARDPKRSGIYSFENRERTLDDQYEQRFRAKKQAWKFFESQPPYYKKVTIFWIMSAKKEETRQRRLDQLIDASAKRVRVGVLDSKKSTD